MRNLTIPHRLLRLFDYGGVAVDVELLLAWHPVLTLRCVRNHKTDDGIMPVTPELPRACKKLLLSWNNGTQG